MTAMYEVVSGVPMPPPPPRGRRKGFPNRPQPCREAVIKAGVSYRAEGKTFIAAATAALAEHRWSATPAHVARLISIASKAEVQLAYSSFNSERSAAYLG